MTRNVFVLVFLLLMCSAAGGQEFTVMSLKGKAECKRSTQKGTAKWHTVSVGDRFNAKDVVRTSYASYVKVLHRGGRLLSIDENSSVMVGDLLGKSGHVSTRHSTASLLRYAAEKLRGEEREQPARNVFGAVRASLDYFTPALPAEAVLPENPSFRWIDTDTSQQYTLFMYDGKLNVCHQGVVEGREAPWPASVRIPADGGLYYWRLRRERDGAVTPPRRITVLSLDSAAFVARELGRLNTELLAMHADDAMRHLIRATYLEQKGLYSDAFSEYEQCLHADPDTREYRDLALSMLEQLQLLEESDYLLK